MRRTTQLQIVRVLVTACGALGLIVALGLAVSSDAPWWLAILLAMTTVVLPVILVRDAGKELRALEADPLEQFLRERDGGEPPSTRSQQERALERERVLVTLFMPFAALLAGWGTFSTTGNVWFPVLLMLNALLYVLSLWWPRRGIRQ